MGLCLTSEAEFDAPEAESGHSPGDFESRANIRRNWRQIVARAHH
jgi:hypothetical protein